MARRSGDSHEASDEDVIADARSAADSTVERRLLPVLYGLIILSKEFLLLLHLSFLLLLRTSVV